MRTADVDLNEQDGSLILVTMGCSHGTLTLSPAAGLGFVSGDTSIWAGDVSFDGVASFYAGLSIANGVLASMTYRPHRNWNGDDTLFVAAEDRGGTTEVRGTFRLLPWSVSERNPCLDAWFGFDVRMIEWWISQCWVTGATPIQH